VIEPGRLVSLGEDEDQVDASALLGVLRECHEVRDRRRAGTTHVSRQALWSFWELPRLPRPILSNKYPRPYPWSPSAREVFLQSGRTSGLVLEHVRPLNILLETMIRSSNSWSASDLIGYLQKFMAGAVITRAEDQALQAAGVSFGPLDQNDSDAWARYRTAQLEPETFSPLEA
jgi:hypothetical protein